MEPLAPITVQPVRKRIRNFREISPGFSKKAALAEARRCPQCSHPTCRMACPLEIDIPLFIRYLREGDYEKALDTIRESNPFPGICGRVCPAPCEKKCILVCEGPPIRIRALERFAYDHGQKKFIKPHPAKKTGRKVAVVGAGPCGLTAAAFLNREGSRVTVWESLPYAGGIMSYGIPSFRLPKKVLDHEVRELEREGVRVRTNTLAPAFPGMDDFSREDFSAVLWATGQRIDGWSGLPGLFLEGVYFAEEILLQGNYFEQDIFMKAVLNKIGPRIVVLGMSNKALDVARLCVRGGKQVSVMTPETSEEEWSVYPDEQEHGREEGVALTILTQPTAVQGKSDKVTGVRCLAMDYGDPEGAGQWRLMTVPGSDNIVEADTVILAEDLTGKGNAGRGPVSLKKSPGKGMIRVDPHTGMTDVSGVFASGAAVQPHLSLAEAMAAGRKAAARMEKYFKETK